MVSAERDKVREPHYLSSNQSLGGGSLSSMSTGGNSDFGSLAGGSGGLRSLMQRQAPMVPRANPYPVKRAIQSQQPLYQRARTANAFRETVKSSSSQASYYNAPLAYYQSKDQPGTRAQPVGDSGDRGGARELKLPKVETRNISLSARTASDVDEMENVDKLTDDTTTGFDGRNNKQPNDGIGSYKYASEVLEPAMMAVMDHNVRHVLSHN